MIGEASSHSKTAHSCHSKWIDCYRGKFFWEVTLHFPVFLCNAVMLFWLWRCFTLLYISQLFPHFHLEAHFLLVLFSQHLRWRVTTSCFLLEAPEKEQAAMSTVTCDGIPAITLEKRLGPWLCQEHLICSKNAELACNCNHHWSCVLHCFSIC